LKDKKEVHCIVCGTLNVLSNVSQDDSFSVPETDPPGLPPEPAVEEPETVKLQSEADAEPELVKLESKKKAKADVDANGFEEIDDVEIDDDFGDDDDLLDV